MFEDIQLRHGQDPVKLDEAEFKRRFAERFYDPSFAQVRGELDRVADVAWKNYSQHHKAPKTEKAGPEFSDPDYDLSVEWRATRDHLQKLQRGWNSSASRILIINASPRNEFTCPGEVSKSFRLMEECAQVIHAQGIEVDRLDLSRATAEYGKQIFPCKACVSTAMLLCHWPCSCYPNHGLGQAPDWMAEIYAQWVAAHGILIITPVHWLQAPTIFKAMIDRLVCADGGNPDPTTTQGKNATLAKKLELKGWDYPHHLAGRAYGLIVHGDSEGAEGLRRQLSDWLNSAGLIPAAACGVIEGYIGYYEPYATSHHALDKDEAFREDARHAALTLARQVAMIRTGWQPADAGLSPARKK